MVANILKCMDLTILYYYIYFRLLSTIKAVIWNFIGLMRNAGFGSWVDWNEV